MITMTKLDLLHRLVLSLLGTAGMDQESRLGSSLCLCSTRTCSSQDGIAIMIARLMMNLMMQVLFILMTLTFPITNYHHHAVDFQS